MPATFSADEYRSLDAHMRKAIERLSAGGTSFEWIGKLPGLSEPMACRLVSLGYAERGKDIRGNVGYRLNDKGWLADGWRRGYRQATSETDAHGADAAIIGGES